jgi:1,2-phenylacetyl-CoA epoxidase catalytic subunit
MSTKTEEVAEEFKQGWIRHLKNLASLEQWGADMGGMFLPEVPVDEPEMWELRHDLSKFAYDESRHARICRQMIVHFGGQERMNEIYDEWHEQGEDQFLFRLNSIARNGFDDYIEFLAVVPVLGDRVGLEFFADAAAQSEDPLWADVAESIHEDERMHVNMSVEWIPYLVEKHEDEVIKERIEEALEDWLPFYHGLNGHPDSEGSKHEIEIGMRTMHSTDFHELQRESLHDLYDPLGIEVPELDDDEYLWTSEILNYAEREIVT